MPISLGCVRHLWPVCLSSSWVTHKLHNSILTTQKNKSSTGSIFCVDEITQHFSVWAFWKQQHRATVSVTLRCLASNSSHGTIWAATDRSPIHSAARQCPQTNSQSHKQPSSETRRTRSRATDGLVPTESWSQHHRVGARQKQLKQLKQLKQPNPQKNWSKFSKKLQNSRPAKYFWRIVHWERELFWKQGVVTANTATTYEIVFCLLHFHGVIKYIKLGLSID